MLVRLIQFGDGALLADAVALGRVDIVELLLTRPDVDVAPIKPVANRKTCLLCVSSLFYWRIPLYACSYCLLQHEDGRPSPERKKCDELIQKALAERHAKGGAESDNNKNKRRSWWDAFGFV